MFLGDKFDEADARKINLTDKAAHRLLEIVETRQRSVRLLPVHGTVLLTFDKPKYDDKLFMENGVPILVVDKGIEGAIGDVLIDADDGDEIGMLSIRHWQEGKYSKPETIALAA